MNAKSKFWILYLIFTALNILDFYTTTVCFFIPEFQEQNPVVAMILANSIGLFLEMKMSIIFAMGALAGLVYTNRKDEGLRIFNHGLVVLNAILCIVCSVNISQLIYYYTTV